MYIYIEGNGIIILIITIIIIMIIIIIVKMTNREGILHLGIIRLKQRIKNNDIIDSRVDNK